MDNPAYHGIWAFLYWWQTAIAGFAALIAGALAYSAAAQQAATARRQLEQARAQHRRTLAANGLSALSILSALLGRVRDEVERVNETAQSRNERFSIGHDEFGLTPVDFMSLIEVLRPTDSLLVQEFLNLCNEIKLTNVESLRPVRRVLDDCERHLAIITHLESEMRAHSERAYRVIQETNSLI